MNAAKYMLDSISKGEINEKFHFCFPWYEITDTVEFLREVRRSTRESLLLEMGGHRPETQFIICKDKIRAWAQENSIQFEYIEERAEYNFFFLKPEPKWEWRSKYREDYRF